MTIRAERAGDAAAIRRVHERAFGQTAEGQLVDALRAGGYVRVSLVAEAEGEIVGHILFSELAIHTARETIAALALAPVAVLPELQRRGIGSQLIRAGLEACCTQGSRMVCVLGEPDYYGRFGFSTHAAAALVSPYPAEYFMALELVPHTLAGVAGEVCYPPPFQAATDR